MPKTIHVDREAPSQGQPALAIPSWETEKLKLAVISLSLANLCFLLTWKQVLGLAEDPFTRYFEEAAPHMGMLLALIFDVFLLAVLVFAFVFLATRGTKAARRTGFAGLLLFCLLAFYQLDRLITQSLTEWRADFPWKIPKALVAVVLLFLIIRFPRNVRRAVVGVLLIAFPVFVILAANGIWQFATVDLHRAGKGAASAPLIPGTETKPHLVWIIFDELDDRLLFDVRPQRIQIPEFERLRAESVYGKARTPSTDTMWAMPSFLLGKRVLYLNLDTSHLGVKFADSRSWINAASLPNVFRSARAMGLNTALTGWHHPYCRIFGNDLNECSWMSFGGAVVRVEKLLRGRSFLQNALYLLEWQARWSVPGIVEPLHLLPYEPEETRMWRLQQTEAMRFIVGNAERMLRNPDLNLLFIHIPTPHPAGIWDPKTNQFTLGDSNYIDNLALADKTLGEIRQVMQQEGDWDSSTVLVSGDHPYRTTMWRATPIWTPEMASLLGERREIYSPFFLKLPNQHSEVDYTREFNSVLSSSLVLEILKSQVTTPQQAVSWLNAHAASSLQ